MISFTFLYITVCGAADISLHQLRLLQCSRLFCLAAGGWTGRSCDAVSGGKLSHYWRTASEPRLYNYFVSVYEYVYMLAFRSEKFSTVDVFVEFATNGPRLAGQILPLHIFPSCQRCLECLPSSICLWWGEGNRSTISTLFSDSLKVPQKLFAADSRSGSNIGVLWLYPFILFSFLFVFDVSVQIAH